MEEVKVHGVYRHYKGDYYLVEDIAEHSETCERMVVYRALYGDNSLWVRPYEMFAQILPDGRPRFALQHIQSVKGEK